MDFLATPFRRRLLFAALYLSEGAPIGFLWLALPTRLKVADVSIQQITALTAVLVIPWTFKFAWAPLVDVLRSRRWTLKHWVLSAQFMMAVTLLPLLWIDPVQSMKLLSVFLVMHAIAAATQDVAIDALCISVTDATERGALNGWMQAGMLAGRAAMGGGALLLGSLIGDTAVVVVLVSITSFSGGLLLCSHVPMLEHDSLPNDKNPIRFVDRVKSVARDLASAVKGPRHWAAFAFALTGPAAFKAFEVIIGPFLIDRGLSENEVGTFTATVMIGAMVYGSVLGGCLADRFQRNSFVAGALAFIVASLSAVAITDIVTNEVGGWLLLLPIAVTGLGIGVFTVAAYALFMDMTEPRIAATQFSAYMGATNGCEAWSTLLLGQLVAGYGYAYGILSLCAVSALSLLLLPAIVRTDSVRTVETESLP